jgi:hypothetical protein
MGYESQRGSASCSLDGIQPKTLVYILPPALIGNESLIQLGVP